MWNKIYSLALAVFSLLMIAMIFYSNSWLQSVDKPANVALNYDYYSNIGWMLLWISSAILLILANVILWTTRNAWAMWVSLLYFAVFTLLQTFWLGQTYFQYQQKNGLTQNAFTFGSFLGIVLCVMAAIIVFFDQFMIKRLREKTSLAEQLPENNSISDEENQVSANE